ncbi:MAG: exodeoxyribonuclease VII large subunit [Caulobacteraceae bacterium]|jgi:exodeoxyribonuclease VII large subunit
MTEALVEPADNARAYSVSELANALKRTIEESYGFVRLRGELSKVTFAASGHVYLDLKDDKAAISGVIWKGTVRQLAVRPETGLEVIVTGRITTYPGRSQYQIVIETMAPAGAGALLAQLERLKQKLAAEGLFSPERKRPLPAMPGVIGVITSPTGAVIRDILHRIADRWPCRVIVWPVLVQGERAAGEVRAAIEGFNALPAGGAIPKPDLLIVARGGGSVEDLWPFNDEAMARAAAASAIPLVSAVGHETDTTLIDFVSDRRAPTPTAAAELATPVLADLVGAVQELSGRLTRSGAQTLEQRRRSLAFAVRGLGRPDDLLAAAAQRLDYAALKLGGALRGNVERHGRQLAGVGGRLRPGLLTAGLDIHNRDLTRASARLAPAVTRRLEALSERLAGQGRVLASLEPKAPLRRGFALVRGAGGRLATSATELEPGEVLDIEFADGHLSGHVDGEPPFALSHPP